ncbi:FxLYD domain-containing protein [Haloterrigena salifodinae]|uniref:Uncharacterized protein n=1 Tax=Haloterrigena salifodinae TaxID=2675099 RepID=A0A8T8E4Q0_9EURY|nr:FxLYD domain-containing protein [Haloterrigena salifodinae]QRV16456.1 hypothetical protein JMJ58_06100 [Haloterrigena salifodinae]
MTQQESTSRRRLLAAVGAGVSAAVAGCTGSGGLAGEPSYEDGNGVEINASNVSSRNTSEMSTAAALANQQPSQSVTPLDPLSLTDHEFIVEDGYLGSTVQGTVENTGSDRLQIVEVRTRIYNDAGNVIGQYLTTTGDLGGGETWEFLVVVLEAPSDVADYDIAVLGTPS